jgi:hypothetical protein
LTSFRIYAYITVIADPFRFFADQVPHHSLTQADFSPQALSMTMQIVNIFLLLAAIGIICCWTTHVSIVRWYLIAVALGDLGHIYATAVGMGPAAFWDVNGWNHIVWGNVGASIFLHVNRLATLLGLFGPLRDVPTTLKQKK